MKSVWITALFWIVSATASATTAPINFTTQTTNDEGEVLLADSVGSTLYVFDLDQGTTTSKCTGDCAELWPPYLLIAAEVSSLKAPLAAITRPNGKSQLTYSGRPVYRFAYDRKAGDDQGDGLGSVWHYIKLK